MNDQNNEELKDIEKTLRKALSSEKQTGLSATQLNSLHLMIAKGEKAQVENRPWRKAWLIPSSIFATALLAFIVFDRFPKLDSVSSETAAPWVGSEDLMQPKAQEPQKNKSLTLKENIVPNTPPPTPSMKSNGAKKKSWESKGKGSSTLKTPSEVASRGGSVASFSNLADSSKAESIAPGAARSFGTSSKKSAVNAKRVAAVSILSLSKVPSETSEQLKAAVNKLSVCNQTPATWKVRLRIAKSGKIETPKINSENGGTDAQAKCIIDEIKRWIIGSSSGAPVELEIRFSGKGN